MKPLRTSISTVGLRTAKASGYSLAGTFESRPRAAALLAEGLVILCSQFRNFWLVRSKVLTHHFVSVAAHRLQASFRSAL
jgi:hypothetical protein